MRCPSSCDATRVGGRAYRPARIVAIGLVLLAVPAVTARAALPSRAEVEQAVLAADTGPGSLKENWQPVVRRLAEVSEQTPDPVLRMLKGHACLAANENNDSVCLFLSVQAPKDQKQWLRWAEDFANRNPNAPIALYYKGDASARLAKWKDAITCFTSAIQHAPRKQHALSFNGRGVVYAQHKDFRTARSDFQSAADASAEKLADAHANIGSVRIDTREGAERALQAFNQVLGSNDGSAQNDALSPKYALALHGRACVEMVLGKAEAAKKDFQLAEQYGRCAVPLLKRNRLRIVAYWRGMTEDQLLAAIRSGADAGTTLDSSMQSVRQAWDAFTDRAGHIGGQFTYNRFHERFSGLNPQQKQNFYKDVVQPALTQNSRLNGIYHEALGNVWNTNKQGGLATWGRDVTDIASKAGGIAFTASGDPLAGAGTIATGEVLQKKIGQWQNHNLNGAATLYNLEHGSLGPPAGGLDMNLANIIWESGDWPFSAYYGLMFEPHGSALPYPEANAKQ